MQVILCWICTRFPENRIRINMLRLATLIDPVHPEVVRRASALERRGRCYLSSTNFLSLISDLPVSSLLLYWIFWLIFFYDLMYFMLALMH